MTTTLDHQLPVKTALRVESGTSTGDTVEVHLTERLG